MDEDIRRALQRVAEEVTPVSNVPPTLRRRVEIRIAFMGAAALLLVSALGIGAAAVLGNTQGDREERAADNVEPPPEATKKLSPSGSITFIANGGGGQDQLRELYEIDADGSGYTRLTREQLMLEGSSSLSWSRDGTKAVFGVGIGEGTAGLSVFDASTAEVSRIYEGSGDEALFGADWAPDGGQLVAYDALGDLVILNADGSGVQRFTESGDRGGHLSPAWSPNGTQIAYACDCGVDSGIYLVEVAGGQEKKLVDGESHDPQWSPDGGRIAYSTQSGEIHVVDIRAGTDMRLTQEFENFDPAWSPDGRSIAFVSNRDGNLDLYVMTSEGEDERAVTMTPADESDPTWRPGG